MQEHGKALVFIFIFLQHVDRISYIYRRLPPIFILIKSKKNQEITCNLFASSILLPLKWIRQNIAAKRQTNVHL